MRLKLIKGLSYSGIIHATAKKPIVEVEDEAIATLAVASGYFVNLDADEVQAEEVEEETETNLQYGGKLLDDMNKSELETFAAYRNVPIKGKKTKASLIEAIRAALPAEELEGEIYYGSPTMVELQN